MRYAVPSGNHKFAERLGSERARHPSGCQAGDWGSVGAAAAVSSHKDSCFPVARASSSEHHVGRSPKKRSRCRFL